MNDNFGRLNYNLYNMAHVIER
uniref:Uncharacterized protein n=1 Tax=Arundo donax TaxID=35708 RepID=A0A0A8Y1A1_ARUDO